MIDIVDNSLDKNKDTFFETFQYQKKCVGVGVSHLYHHQGECDYNQYNQCRKGYRYFCWQCKKGVGGMMSICYNCHN